MRRRFYRPDQSAELERIERRRLAMAIPCEVLAGRAGVPLRTLMRIRRDGRAWLRQVRALTYALRAIEREQRLADDTFQRGD